MNFKIEIFEKYPGLHIGIVHAFSVDNGGVSDEVISLLRAEEKRIREEFDASTLSENPKIAAWRAAYSAFGAKPKKYKCSVENLYRMILDDIELKHINKLVDIYNYVSIKHTIPLGGDDIDKVDGDIILKLASGEEPFTELNSEEIKNPKPGEVVYCDNKEVLCRRWNWRECDKSKMTEGTTNALLVVEGLPPVTRAEVEDIIKELSELIENHTGATTKTTVIDADKGFVAIQ